MAKLAKAPALPPTVRPTLAKVLDPFTLPPVRGVAPPGFVTFSGGLPDEKKKDAAPPVNQGDDAGQARRRAERQRNRDLREQAEQIENLRRRGLDQDGKTPLPGFVPNPRGGDPVPLGVNVVSFDGPGVLDRRPPGPVLPSIAPDGPDVPAVPGIPLTPPPVQLEDPPRGTAGVAKPIPPKRTSRNTPRIVRNPPRPSGIPRPRPSTSPPASLPSPPVTPSKVPGGRSGASGAVLVDIALDVVLDQVRDDVAEIVAPGIDPAEIREITDSLVIDPATNPLSPRPVNQDVFNKIADAALEIVGGAVEVVSEVINNPIPGSQIDPIVIPFKGGGSPAPIDELAMSIDPSGVGGGDGEYNPANEDCAGPCGFDDDVDRAGRRCGGRSACSRQGGCRPSGDCTE